MILERCWISNNGDCEIRYVCLNLYFKFQEVKISSPDYRNTNQDEAITDFKKRIAYYESQYETIDDEKDRDLSFIKIFDQGERYLVNRVQGELVYK